MKGALTISSNCTISALAESMELDLKLRQLAVDLSDRAAVLLEEATLSALKASSANTAPIFLRTELFAKNDTPRSLRWQQQASSLCKQAITLAGTLEVLAGEDPAPTQDCLTSGEHMVSPRRQGGLWHACAMQGSLFLPYAFETLLPSQPQSSCVLQSRLYLCTRFCLVLRRKSGAS